MSELLNKKCIPIWKWFKLSVTKLGNLNRLFLEDEDERDEKKREKYFENLRVISEVYYNLNYNLKNILINDKEVIKKESLNKRIVIIYNNIQNLIKIIEDSNKYNPDTKQEKRAYNIIMEQFKSVKLTIQKYFKEEEEEKEEKVKIKRDPLNPNHIRFIYK